MIAGILMVLTGCFRNVEAAYKTINWESIVLIAAMLPMSLALEKTGASEYISNSLVSELGTYGPLALMAGIYFTTSLMTMFISNTATAVLLAPIAMQSATQIGVSPVPFLFAVTLGASMCFASPFSTPPNALVMPAGQYTFYRAPEHSHPAPKPARDPNRRNRCRKPNRRRRSPIATASPGNPSTPVSAGNSRNRKPQSRIHTNRDLSPT